MEIIIRIEIPDGSQVGIKDDSQTAISKLPLLPKTQFHCDGCGADFMTPALTSQVQCACGGIADRVKPPIDPQDTMLCVSCGREYKRATGGQQGTCPDCTTVRCPTCKLPAALSGMVGKFCPACNPARR